MLTRDRQIGLLAVPMLGTAAILMWGPGHAADPWPYILLGCGIALALISMRVRRRDEAARRR